MNLDDPNERDLLAGEYALGVLSRDDEAEFERRLDRDAALQKALLGWEDRLLPLATLAPAVEPPRELWARIERSVKPPAPAPARAPAASRWWDSVGPWRFATAAALALLLAVVLLPPRDAPSYVAVLAAADNSAGWLVQVDAREGVRLVPLVDTPVPAGKALQFWTLIDPAKGPVSLGLVPRDRATKVGADRLPGIQRGQLFELTLEPEGGSPYSRPSGPILFKGRLTPSA